MGLLFVVMIFKYFLILKILVLKFVFFKKKNIDIFMYLLNLITKKI